LVSLEVGVWKKHRVGRSARDYYEVLGIARDADAETVKRAFRSSARRFHPDVSTDPDADGTFRELADAYAALSKPASRLLYDRFGYRGRGAWTATSFDRWTRPRERESRVGEAVELELEFFEAARGGRRRVRYRSRGPCPACAGSGSRGGTASPCAACEGRGHVRESDESGAVRLIQLVRCEVCGGSGQLVIDRCPECSGWGATEAQREAEVTFPSGVDDGARLPLDAHGAQVVVRVRPQTPDSAFVRGAATVGLVVAIAFAVFLFIG
jgi:molecular chaperone DnaJ